MIMPCVACKRPYDLETLTTYIREKYPHLCGKCIVKVIDAIAEAGAYSDCYGNGCELVDYVPSVAPLAVDCEAN